MKKNMYKKRKWLFHAQKRIAYKSLKVSRKKNLLIVNKNTVLSFKNTKVLHLQIFMARFWMASLDETHIDTTHVCLIKLFQIE